VSTAVMSLSFTQDTTTLNPGDKPTIVTEVLDGFPQLFQSPEVLAKIYSGFRQLLCLS